MYATLGLYVSWDLIVYAVVRFILFTFMVVYIYILVLDYSSVLCVCIKQGHWHGTSHRTDDINILYLLFSLTSKK